MPIPVEMVNALLITLTDETKVAISEGDQTRILQHQSAFGTTQPHLNPPLIWGGLFW